MRVVVGVNRARFKVEGRAGRRRTAPVPRKDLDLVPRVVFQRFHRRHEDQATVDRLAFVFVRAVLVVEHPVDAAVFAGVVFRRGLGEAYVGIRNRIARRDAGRIQDGLDDVSAGRAGVQYALSGRTAVQVRAAPSVPADRRGRHELVAAVPFCGNLEYLIPDRAVLAEHRLLHQRPKSVPLKELHHAVQSLRLGRRGGGVGLRIAGNELEGTWQICRGRAGRCHASHHLRGVVRPEPVECIPNLPHFVEGHLLFGVIDDLAPVYHGHARADDGDDRHHDEQLDQRKGFSIHLSHMASPAEPRQEEGGMVRLGSRYKSSVQAISSM